MKSNARRKQILLYRNSRTKENKISERIENNDQIQ